MSLRAVVLSLVLFAHPAAADLRIKPGAGVFTVDAGGARWEISTATFDVVHAAALRGEPRLGPGQVSVEALGGKLTFGAPSESKSGNDWVELRGWADHDKNLWYVARYQFFADKPFLRLVLTLTDRHDTSPANDPGDRYWRGRTLAHWRLQIGAPKGHPSTITQHNSYSFSSPGAPFAEVVQVNGAPYQWAPPVPPLDGKRFEVVHIAKDGANQIIWHPMLDGKAELAALIAPYGGGAEYKIAKAATYEVVDAGGQTHSISAAQSGDTVKLGTFTLGKNSVVRLKATGGGSEMILAGALRVTPSGGHPFEIPLGARSEGLLNDGPLTMVIKDFWQHHPISLVRTESTIGWDAIRDPERYTGGMGLTLETLISLDGPAASASAALYAPPPRQWPPGAAPVDGSTAQSAAAKRYDALLAVFADHFWSDLEQMDSFGWRNWGDYQIGNSYTSEHGPVEDWANLQYDLPYGLLTAWMRTGDPRLWRFAQASVRHLMDLDLVKFHPFLDKLNGLVYRKGEMLRTESHFAAEPIVDQGFAFRSLLLYYSLTHEEWAKDLARQNIDRLVDYAQTRPQYVLRGGRPTAWMLRAALAGIDAFPEDAKKYRAVADQIVALLLDSYKAYGRLPGRQPVWQGQVLEGLARYHRLTNNAEVGQMIVGQVRKLLNESVRKKPDGQYEFMYCLQIESDCSPQWVGEENYLFLWLGSIAYANHLSHDPFFAKWADTLFAYGEAKMRDHQDIRSWTSVLGFPHMFVDLR